jgi:D-sedoheptulose 7-phosphate isomerase
MQEKILNAVQDGIDAVSQLKRPSSISFIESAASVIASAFKSGNKLIIAGNGGSLCDANHFAEELTGVFRKLRPALPAISLSEAGHLSCVGNDLGFEHVFSRGIEAYGKTNDVFVGLTTSGNSLNLILAFDAARKRGLKTVAFLGKGGGQLKGVADIELVIDGFATSDRIQEAHMAAIHILIEMIEEILFYSPKSSTKVSLDDLLSTHAT